MHCDALETNHMVETSLIYTGKDKNVPYIGLFPKIQKHEAMWVRNDGILYNASRGQVHIFGRTLSATSAKEGDTYGLGYDGFKVVPPFPLVRGNGLRWLS